MLSGGVPMSGFDSFLGNESLISRLKSDIAGGRLLHAYIIEGGEGCGKKTLASLICMALSCKEEASPCTECTVCSKIKRLQTPDIIIAEAEKDRVQIGVDVVRRIREDAVYAPIELPKRFFIIPKADTMNTQAQNALLKTLEEPPTHVMFLILVENAEELLPTIRSRAPVLRVSALSDGIIKEKLLHDSEKAKKLSESDSDAFHAAIKLSRGSLGTAIRMTDPGNAEECLKLYRKAERFIELLSKRRDAASELEFYSFAASMAGSKERDALVKIYGLLADAVRDLLNAKLAKNPTPIFYTSAEKAYAVAEGFTAGRLMALADIFIEAKESLRRNVNLGLVQVRTASAVLSAGRTK